MTDSSSPTARPGATRDAAGRPDLPAGAEAGSAKGTSAPERPAHVADATGARRGPRRWFRRGRRDDVTAPEAGSATPVTPTAAPAAPPVDGTTTSTGTRPADTGAVATGTSTGATSAGTGPTGTSTGPTSTGPTSASTAPSAAADEPASSAPEATSGPAPDRRTARRRRVLRWTGLAVLVLLLATAVVAAVHLFRTSQAWEDRAEEYLATAQGVGEDLAGTRAELAGTQSELEAIRTQLETAKARIVELADEKAQAGDDVEAQRQLVDYQQRVSEAAGDVALALDQCVQGQEQLITYLEAQAAAAVADRPAPYGQAELTQYADDVENLCRTATEANVALQQELQQ